MRLLMLTSYCEPEMISDTYLAKNRNEAFARAGIETVVYCPTPTRGITPEVRQQYSIARRK